MNHQADVGFTEWIVLRLMIERRHDHNVCLVCVRMLLINDADTSTWKETLKFNSHVLVPVRKCLEGCSPAGRTMRTEHRSCLAAKTLHPIFLLVVHTHHLLACVERCRDCLKTRVTHEEGGRGSAFLVHVDDLHVWIHPP